MLIFPDPRSRARYRRTKPMSATRRARCPCPPHPPLSPSSRITMATNMNQQPSYWFPTMKVSEIKAILDEWQLPVTEQQIKQPTGEVVQALYSALLQQLTGISEEVLEESVARALLSNDEFPVRFFDLVVSSGSLMDRRNRNFMRRVFV